MNDNLYLLAVLLLAAGVTFLIRAVPLLLGSRFVQSHPWIRSLGGFLPLSVMVVLVSIFAGAALYVAYANGAFPPIF